MSKIYRIMAEEVAEKVCELALTANMYLPEDVKRALAVFERELLGWLL